MVLPSSTNEATAARPDSAQPTQRNGPAPSAIFSGATVSAEQLLERVWDEQTDPFTNVVRMTIMTLRRKLGEPPVVETVIGVGYRMA